jgi:hypothetical protein
VTFARLTVLGVLWLCDVPCPRVATLAGAGAFSIFCLWQKAAHFAVLGFGRLGLHACSTLSLLSQGLMSLLDQDAYGDTDDFMEQYGSDTPSLEQIRALQVGTATMTLSQNRQDFWRFCIYSINCAAGLCVAHSCDLQMDACCMCGRETQLERLCLLLTGGCCDCFCVCVAQAALAPVLLRRMKEDVEDLPEKEEVVIWVELTAEQRR